MVIKNSNSTVLPFESRLKSIFIVSFLQQVAFSAALSASGELRVGPSNDYTTLVYKHVMSNIGNAYNPLTGKKMS